MKIHLQLQAQNCNFFAWKANHMKGKLWFKQRSSVISDNNKGNIHNDIKEFLFEHCFYLPPKGV